MARKYFITQYNLLRLFKGLVSKYVIEKQAYYKYEIEEFKDEDRALLLFIRLFLENPSMVSKHLTQLKNIESFSFLFAPTSPAYHLDQNCTALLKEYYNFHLPEGIKNYPDRVEECRHLFKQQLQHISVGFKSASKEEYLIAIAGLVEAIKENEYFKCVFKKDGRSIDDLKPEDFISIEKKNSSQSSIRFIEQEIDDLYAVFKVDYRTSAKQKGYKRPQAFRLEAVNVFRRKYQEQILKLIIEFIIEQLNPNLEFDRRILIDLGFHGCSYCLDDKNLVLETQLELGASHYTSKKNIEMLFELQSFGKFSPVNSRSNPLKTIKDIKAASEGAYYCLHKFKNRLQIVFKLPKGKWIYADLPEHDSGELILTDFYEAFIGKRKNISENIRGSEKNEIIIFPTNKG